MLITVSGPPGSAKSTAAPALADERGDTPLEFDTLAEEDDQIDRDPESPARTSSPSTANAPDAPYSQSISGRGGE